MKNGGIRERMKEVRLFYTTGSTEFVVNLIIDENINHRGSKKGQNNDRNNYHLKD